MKIKVVVSEKPSDVVLDGSGRGQFVASGLLGGAFVTQAAGATKREARRACWRSLEEMGLVTDGVERAI